jgi:hypothetical protein
MDLPAVLVRPAEPAEVRLFDDDEVGLPAVDPIES